MFNKIKSQIARYLLPQSEMIIPAEKYVELTLKKSEQKVTPLTPAELTMKQLGSYIPNFSVLENQSDEFKTQLGAVCETLIKSEHFNYLINHLKQDQVNNLLFQDPKPDEMWVRGSINGIYVVDDTVRMLGLAHAKNTPTLKKEENKPKS